MEKIVTPVVSHKREPVTPVYLVYLKNNFNPEKPWAQVWYDDFTAYPDAGGMLKERMLVKYRIEWEHRFLGIENLMQLYPYKPNAAEPKVLENPSA